MTQILQPVETEAQYERALNVIERLFEQGPPSSESEEGQQLASLIKLVEAYEEDHHPIGPSTPNEILRHELERTGLSQKQLSEKTGIAESRISDLVNGKRDASARQVAILSDFFDISADLLLPKTSSKRAS